jgi:hypothetical protein
MLSEKSHPHRMYCRKASLYSYQTRTLEIQHYYDSDVSHYLKLGTLTCTLVYQLYNILHINNTVLPPPQTQLLPWATSPI